MNWFFPTCWPSMVLQAPDGLACFDMTCTQWCRCQVGLLGGSTALRWKFHFKLNLTPDIDSFLSWDIGPKIATIVELFMLCPLCPLVWSIDGWRTQLQMPPSPTPARDRNEIPRIWIPLTTSSSLITMIQQDHWWFISVARLGAVFRKCCAQGRGIQQRLDKLWRNVYATWLFVWTAVAELFNQKSQRRRP